MGHVEIMTTDDAGEHLVEVAARLAERIEAREQERQLRSAVVLRGDPEQIRQLESCRLARADLRRQLETTAHDLRRTQLTEALAVLDRRIATLSA